MGDVNGDGFGDLIVGDPFAEGGTGRGYLFVGSTALLPTIPSDVYSPMPTPAPYEFAELGYWSTFAGDLNGDGFGDFAFGTDGQDRVYVGLGSAGGVVTLSYVDGSRYSVPGDFADFGGSVAGAGDLDGDGYADLIVAADGFEGSTGTAFLFFGGPDGVASRPDLQLDLPPGAYGRFGNAVEGVGDVNGDGLGDLAIGSEGSVAVYYGRADRHMEAPDVVLYSVDPGAGIPGLAFGTVLGTPGDLNGDGYADLIVGAPQDGADGNGRVYVFQGGATGVSTVPQELQGSSLAGFGSRVACPGDVDGDGYEDLVATSINVSTGVDALFFFRGDRGGPLSLPIELGPYDSGRFGISVATSSLRHESTRRAYGQQICWRSYHTARKTLAPGELQVQLGTIGANLIALEGTI